MRPGTAPAPISARRTRLREVPEMRWAAASSVLFLLGLTAQLGGAPSWTATALYLACYGAGGWEPGLAGLRALRAKTLDVDLLMVVAAIGAAAIGQVMDGGLLIVIFAVSGALEAVATARTEDSVRGLLDYAPDTATLLTDGGERTVEAKGLDVGAVILVRPGERIAADGTVLGGASEVDQATVTGESMPVDKCTGDEVFAGTLNGTGVLRVRVDRRAADSVVARIAGLVEEASRTKAKTQLFIEKIEQRYSVGMVVATLAVFTIPLTFGATLRDSLLRAMTFMIVASPCAVVLATMPPLLAAIATAGRHGVLVKSAVVMEQLGTTTRVAFDKTGTLTRGVPELTEIRCLGTESSDEAILRLAAGAELASEHPLARAIVRAAHRRGLEVPPAEDFTAQPGRGVSALVDGRHIRVGSPAAVLPAADENATAIIETLRARGATAVVVLGDGIPIAVLGITDQVRPEAAAAVTALTASSDAPPVLLTGDDHTTAVQLAAQVGITEVRANLLPEAKVSAIRDLEAGGARVTMVGDGINDAPALATAHVGIAMGGAGSDLALQTADAIVIRDDLTTIPAVIALSRRARRVVLANLAIAGTFIAVLVTWDLVGHLPLPLGVAGHEGSTVIVGLNGLRLLRSAAWRRAQQAHAEPKVSL
ncbi:heavy metal translocating P-type ATPase [Nocardia mangyaensis]|nr:heavy metal translocating P-type ATPase [Nocardia mangyaensis]MDO3648337.1 heavy metal translocating P-type ATPase [Nocardia mangyaensis]